MKKKIEFIVLNILILLLIGSCEKESLDLSVPEDLFTKQIVNPGTEGLQNTLLEQKTNYSLHPAACPYPQLSPDGLPLLKWPLEGKQDDYKSGIAYGIKVKKDSCGGFSKVHVGRDIVPGNGENMAGTRVFSLQDGIIRKVFNAASPYVDGDGGVVIEHRDLKGQKFTSIYQHLNLKYEIREGEMVNMGQELGQVSMRPDGAHLHLGIRRGEFDEICLRDALPDAKVEDCDCFSAGNIDAEFPEFFVNPMHASFFDTPPAPEIIMPLGNTIAIPVVFDWKDIQIPGVSYRLQVATSMNSWSKERGFSDSSALVLDRDVGAKSAFTWAKNDSEENTIQPGTSYYWSLQVVSEEYGNSSFSRYAAFRTKGRKLSDQILASPLLPERSVCNENR